ncbi:hypothetical protein FKM82_004555 [Ascaphus truei]
MKCNKTAEPLYLFKGAAVSLLKQLPARTPPLLLPPKRRRLLTYIQKTSNKRAEKDFGARSLEKTRK